MELYGLVLMGGKSERMGEDKSKLVYHKQLSQMENIYNLLNDYCSKTFLSINQSKEKESFPYQTLVDLEENKGPISGILSAFHFKNDVAWLVCPIDMPFVSKETIDYLLKNRKVEKDCTCFLNSEIQAPDPLLAIYEPTIYTQLIQAKKQGHRCPKKSILSSNHHMILPLEEKWLFNANTPEQFDKAKNQIKQA